MRLCDDFCWWLDRYARRHGPCDLLSHTRGAGIANVRRQSKPNQRGVGLGYTGGPFPWRRTRPVACSRRHHVHDADEFNKTRVFGGGTSTRRLIWNNLELKPYRRGTSFVPQGQSWKVGAAELIQSTDVEKVHAYALCAECLVLLLYLEAGSGADEPVHPDLIAKAATVEGLTLLVGGGLRTASDVRLAVSAGAKWIVRAPLRRMHRQWTNFANGCSLCERR